MIQDDPNLSKFIQNQVLAIKMEQFHIILVSK